MTERTNFLVGTRKHSRQWLAFCGASTIALGTTIASWALDDAKPAESAGLRGILPADVPNALGEDAFAALEGNWKDWGTQASADVAKFYADVATDVGAQRQQLDVLKKKLATMESSLKDARYRSIHETLFSLHSALGRRVALAEAVLDTLALDPKKAASARLDGARADLSKSLQELEAELKTVKNGPAWLSYVRSSEIVSLVSEKKAGKDALPVLTAVQGKLSPTETTSPEIRKFLEGSRFVALRQAVSDFVKVTAAVDQPIDADKLRAELTNLVASTEKFEESRSTLDAAGVRKAFDAVRKASSDGGERVAAAMATHYFNYNLRVVVSEKFLSRIANHTQTNQGPVHDNVLGANVNGQQTTTATAGVDLKPNNSGINFNITLNGVSQSNTSGVTQDATVFTSGYHRFQAWKPVTFDGTKFIPGQADISVAANNTTTGVSTRASGIPIFGGIADSIARGEVENRRGQAEAIAAQRLSSRVLPEFTQEVDKKLAAMNTDLDSGVNARLKKKDLWPSATSYRSSEDEMRANLRLMATHELAGGDGPFTSVPTTGFVVAMHESLFNNSMDRLKFGGRTISEAELKTELSKSFEELLGRPLNAAKKIADGAPPSNDPATFIFPEHNPIQFRVDNGLLTLVIHAGLKQKEGEEDIPTQEITVPLSFKIDGKDLVIESGNVGVSPVEAPKNATLQIARSGVVRTKIQNALPTRKFDRFVTIDKGLQTPVSVGINSVKTAGGWMVLTFE
ncbi:MAG: hypothetical protein NT013_04565 [Planctomycetia bacterium]|nr:hypothetical protein [Planctomycetia bacterium]